MVKDPSRNVDLSRPRVYVDLLHTDGKRHDDGGRRLLLDLVGTREDLARHGIVLREGMTLLLYSDDADVDGKSDALLVEGRVHFDSSTDMWVAVIDPEQVAHESTLAKRGKETS